MNYILPKHDISYIEEISSVIEVSSACVLMNSSDVAAAVAVANVDEIISANSPAKPVAARTGSTMS